MLRPDEAPKKRRSRGRGRKRSDDDGSAGGRGSPGTPEG
jgi:hypothetical protein